MTKKTKFSFVFPGQGSQSIGMMDDLAQHFNRVKETFAQASDALGYDLWQITCQDSNGQLNQTQYTQPALLAAGIATWRIWQEQGGAQPNCFAGHSLGEYTALVAADCISFEDAIRLVSKRGEFMQAAVPNGQGAMAAIIGLSNADVAELCIEAAKDDILSPANFNSPGQVVIAGTQLAVKRACELAKPKGAKMAIVLPVSVPSHCALMQPAAKHMQALLERTTFSAPSIGVYQNVDAKNHQDVTVIRENLVAQLCSPVQWTDTINNIIHTGVERIVECGPGKILAGLNKRISKQVTHAAMYNTVTLQDELKHGVEHE